MKKIIKIGFISLLSSFLLLLTACAPRMNGLFQDPSFTYNTLTQGGLAIGGVATARQKPADPSVIATESRYSELLREAILNERPGVTIMPAGDVAQILGKQYDPMMDYYAYRDVTADEYLKTISAKTTHIRYVMFASIPTNAVTQVQSDNGDSLSYSTYRSVGVSVKIYDLSTRQIVWSGSLNGSNVASNTYQTTQIKDPQNTAEAIASSVIGGLEKDQIERRATYPNPPDATPIVSNIFEGIAENLPKKPKKKK